MLRKLEKYEIVEQIGHGGMATVYRARDSLLERPVALKVLHPHLHSAEEARSRFAREAKSVARLRHPNILEVFDYSGEDSEQSYIASELLTGPTLKRFCEQRETPIPAEIAACFAIQVARALRAAHAEGIIHRDVKPENVLLHENRCTKLTDFGIAQMVDAQSFTVTGQVLGSPGHMAPEQVEGGACDARTDLFSLGTVLYFLAVGKLPFTGKNPHQVLKRIVDGDYVDPLRARPRIGGRLAAIIRKAMSADPDARHQSAEELEAELLDFVGRVGIEDPDQMLAEFLDDPDTVSRELEQRVIERYTDQGERAAREGRVPEALDDFNRVLAIDEGNTRVMQLVEQVGRRSTHRRRALVAAGVGLGALGVALGVIGYATGGPSRGPRASASAPAHVAAGPPTAEAGVSETAAADGAPGEGSDGRQEQRAGDAGESDRRGPADRGSARDSGTPGAREAADRAKTRHRSRRARAARSERPRTVVFRPHPQNVRIAIDGRKPRPFGPSFHKTRLDPGVHRIAFLDGSDCCIDAEFKVRIPPGPGTTVIERRLRYRPAGLYVVSNTPADVQVGQGRAKGRTREVIRVPMEGEIEEVVPVSVTAPGHGDYTGEVNLRAGDVSQLKVTLEASGSSP